MKSNLMGLAIILMSLLAVIMSAVTFFVPQPKQAGVFNSIPFIMVWAAVGIFILYCSFTRGLNTKMTGFLLCHLGIILILAGSLAGTILGREVRFNIPVDGKHSYSTINQDGGNTVEFGFGISIESFHVEKYPVVGEKGGTDKDYLAVMRVDEFDGRTLRMELKVNKPVSNKVWNFYIMDYDSAGNKFISILAKRDPGRTPVRYGILFTIAGTFCLCFRNILKGREGV